jgi:hypothetical protein
MGAEWRRMQEATAVMAPASGKFRGCETRDTPTLETRSETLMQAFASLLCK